ncbi:MAG: SprT-like domain-containing protein [Chlamydiota bacterium]
MRDVLQSICPIPLTIVWHENRTSYLSIRKERGHLHLRLHRLFLKAPSPVLEALIRFALKRDPEAGIILKKMAHFYFSENRTPAKPLRASGVVYDLQAIYDRIKEAHFEPSFHAEIGWAPIRVRTSKFRSITFGTYDLHRHQIRLNPLLDDPDVPLYFLEFIVYHEMLHAVCPSHIDSSGRCRVHTPQFRQKEKEFPQFAKAKAWENLSLKFFAGKRKKIYGRA